LIIVFSDRWSAFYRYENDKIPTLDSNSAVLKWRQLAWGFNYGNKFTRKGAYLSNHLHN